MWLQLRQVLKTSTEGNARKFTASFAFCDLLLLASWEIPVGKNYDIRTDPQPNNNVFIFFFLR